MKIEENLAGIEKIIQGNFRDGERLDMTPTMAKFVGAVEVINYEAWQYQIAAENGMNEAAMRDISNVRGYLEYLGEKLTNDQIKTFSPIKDRLW